VLPGADGHCPSCRAYDFARKQVVDEAVAAKVRRSVAEAAKPRRALHPLSVVSCGMGIASVAAGPIPAVVAGLLGAGAGWWASRDIRNSGGADAGVWLARAGMVLGLGVALAWLGVLVVGRYASK
jgi:hypothetical protein